MSARPLTAKQIGQVVLVHQIPVPLSAILVYLLRVLFLVLGQDQLLAPMVLPPTLHVRHFAIRTAMHRLGYAVNVSSLVVLEVLFQMQPHITG